MNTIDKPVGDGLELIRVLLADPFLTNVEVQQYAEASLETKNELKEKKDERRRGVTQEYTI